MITIYNVVPADRFFDGDQFASFPNCRMAAQHIAGLKASGDDSDYGIFETRLIDGSAKMTYGRTMHVVGERRVVTSKHHLACYSAHDDGLGEDTSPYGYGDTPEAAIADLLAALEGMNTTKPDKLDHAGELMECVNDLRRYADNMLNDPDSWWSLNQAFMLVEKARQIICRMDDRKSYERDE